MESKMGLPMGHALRVVHERICGHLVCLKMKIHQDVLDEQWGLHLPVGRIELKTSRWPAHHLLTDVQKPDNNNMTPCNNRAKTLEQPHRNLAKALQHVAKNFFGCDDKFIQLD